MQQTTTGMSRAPYLLASLTQASRSSNDLRLVTSYTKIALQDTWGQQMPQFFTPTRHAVHEGGTHPLSVLIELVPDLEELVLA